MRIPYKAMYDMIKRIMDLCIAVIALIITCPIFIIISIAIKVEDGGKVFYLQNGLSTVSRTDFIRYGIS